MKFWQSTSFTEPDQLIEVAKMVEECGFEGAFVSDHLFYPEKMDPNYPYSADGSLPDFTADTPWPDALTTIAAMASVTSTLRFSTLVYILPLRRPIDVAKICSTLDLFSNGRFALGAGAGWMHEEFDILDVEFKKRGKLFDESIEILRKLWTGEMVEHQGAGWSFPRILMNPRPSAQIPIFIGGVSKAALRRAARLGDGWIGSGQTPDEALAMLGDLNQLRKEYGRENLPFEAVCPLVTPPDPDTYKRLEDAGCSGTVSYPFTYTVGPTSNLDQKRAYLEGFADNVIKTMG